VRSRTTGWRLAVAGLALANAAGCTGTQGTEREARNPDPFEPVNRAIYKFNDLGDRYVAKPVAQAYEKGTPRAFRAGAGNFFDNLRYPITVINDVLQGKFRQGGADLARFAINSTVGLGGIFDPAEDIGLRNNDEDFGQTFSVWGLPEGPYLMVPIFGPYTVSSGVGDLLGTQVSLLVQLPDEGRVAMWIWYLVHLRYGVLGADEEVQRAFDPYIFIRDAYLQNRRYKTLDGDVPEDELFLEDELDEEPTDEEGMAPEAGPP
jgi:phospholipid-binding lipoprotein MlaA